LEQQKGHTLDNSEYLNDKKSILTIYSQTGNFKGSSFTFGAHSWISITDIQTGETTYYGTWGNTNNGGNYGFRENDSYEKETSEKCMSGEITNVEYRSVLINESQQEKLEKYINKMKKKDENAWGYWTPCSYFASKAWKKATGEELEDRHLCGLGYSDPNVLADSIREKNKIETNQKN
jgi:hypothetical protein